MSKPGFESHAAGPLIAVNAAFYSKHRNGVNVMTENLLSELSSRWHMLVYTSVPEAFRVLPVRIRALPTWTQGHRGRMIWAYLGLPRRLREDRADLVLSVFCEAPIRPAIPSIAMVHDLTPIVLRGSTSFGYRALFWISLEMLRGTTAVVTDSEHTRQDLLSRSLLRASTIHVIHCGTRFPDIAVCGSDIILPRQTPGPGADPFILYVGGFLAHKDVPLLVSAFHELAPEIPHRLVLVGWGPERVLKNLGVSIVRAGLENRVMLMHDLPALQLASLYASCSLFVFPSRYEGFGLPVLEAMACGAPVLCSDASSLPEIGGDAVLYFTPGSRRQLVAGMRRLIEDAGLRRELARRGRDRARLFSWSTTARAFSELIERLLQDSGRR